MGWERVRLEFARGVSVRFADRDEALRQVERVAERGTRFPVVVYGPEGCGKTALFRQAVEILKSHGYGVVYVNPAASVKDEKVVSTEDVKEIVGATVGLLEPAAATLAEKAFELVSRLLSVKRRVAVILDEVFQAVGPERAEVYVKALLDAIEYPSARYESFVAIIGSSEGTTRARVARHSWATIRVLWNMAREGFKELYDQIPGPGLDFDSAWRLTGGNPRYLAMLYEHGWDAGSLVEEVVSARRLKAFASRLTPLQLEALSEAVEDPDRLLEYLKRGEPSIERLVDSLVELNLVAEIPDRGYGWLDKAPPEKDPSLGIGRFYAWQTPIHREAVRRALSGVHERA
ncbi:ATP-binding protein [Thermofilum pendens]|uniref:AAA ATPase n=1 Tax=Thermofilum pendens (strain DSM 2475 / Hrk 5) TaxID=368408 RepID=A1RZZ8_THEPD|nr:ATP-binding protein [Thermofilum pendens]ABL78778.1 AAA ATPase [Thermofilum pendens Hrk 5]